MAGKPGRSGGARPGSGGKRPGAGRPKGSSGIALCAARELKKESDHQQIISFRSSLDELLVTLEEFEMEIGASTKLERLKNSLRYARRLLQQTVDSGTHIPEHVVRTKLLQLRVKRLAKSIRAQLDKD